MTKILICLLFKNSELWFNRFMNCIYNLIEDNKHEESSVDYSLCAVYGTSIDNTYEMLVSSKSELLKNNVNLELIKTDLPERLDSLQKLAFLRNSFKNINDMRKYDYVLQIDTDIIFEPYIIKRMIKNIENPKLENAGIIAPMIFIENYSDDYFYDTFAFRIKNRMFTHRKPYLPVELQQNKKKWIIEVDSVGSLYLIKTDVFYKYNIEYDTYERDNTKEHVQRKYESEQVVFCNNIRKYTPYKIYVDLSSKVYHINLEQYGLAWH